MLLIQDNLANAELSFFAKTIWKIFHLVYNSKLKTTQHERGAAMYDTRKTN